MTCAERCRAPDVALRPARAAGYLVRVFIHGLSS